MEFISDELLCYCENFTSPESGLLYDLNRQTHLKVGQPRMLSGHIQGRILSMFSKMVQPACILEIGTYTGYSALCLAEGLKSNGKLFTIDSNEETAPFAKSFFDKSIFKDKIIQISGLASKIIPELNNKWDLVFIDADKKNYGLYYDLVIDHVNPGGIIIADNVLWSGKVLQEKKDPDTEAIHAFNKKLTEDYRIENILLPVRDGLMVIRKKEEIH
jgi:caffeoyl-CoA O-methyltransferase